MNKVDKSSDELGFSVRTAESLSPDQPDVSLTIRQTSSEAE